MIMGKYKCETLKINAKFITLPFLTFTLPNIVFNFHDTLTLVKPTTIFLYLLALVIISISNSNSTANYLC